MYYILIDKYIIFLKDIITPMDNLKTNNVNSNINLNKRTSIVNNIKTNKYNYIIDIYICVLVGLS